MGSPEVPIIDVHTHILPPELIARAHELEERDEHFRALSRTPNNRYATVEELVRDMDGAGVSLSVTFGFAFKDPGLCREVNDYVAASVALYPDRLIGFMCVQPFDPGLEREISRCAAAGLRGVGELFPDGQGFSLKEGPARLGGLCREAGLPLLLHVNEQVGHFYPGKGGQGAADAYAFAAANPGLRVCFAHWGGGLLFYELMPEVRRVLENVYYDTAAGPFLYDPRVYDVAKASGCIRKVLFGTDYPLLGPERYIRRMGDGRLGDDDVRMILSENARRFLDLH
ncbi:MAG: amidohydrolase [Firmicutes bacterium]|nr:amidohydrolase [Bacillota bacterium]